MEQSAETPVMKVWLLMVLLSLVCWAEPPAEEVWKAVEAAGVPRELAQMRFSASFPEVAAIGWQPPDRGLELKAIYLDGRYCSPTLATAGILSRLSAETSVSWVTEVLLSFEHPLLVSPAEFAGTTQFEEPGSQPDGAGGYKVKVWVREGKGSEFSLRQYHLTQKGARLSVLRRWQPRSGPSGY